MVVAFVVCGVVVRAVAAGAQMRVVSLKKTCAVSVPAGWRIDKWISSDAASPDHSAEVTIDSDARAASLTAIKPLLQSMFKPIHVFEDRPQRLWYAYRGGAGSGTHWYVGVPGQVGICAAQISFRSAAQTGLARRIAMSVGPAS